MRDRYIGPDQRVDRRGRSWDLKKWDSVWMGSIVYQIKIVVTTPSLAKITNHKHSSLLKNQCENRREDT